ncbi:TraX family protein [Pseudomonas sp. 2FE]|uniref:TraX family protein n=1 Tax=Pseudomonas sp. 2FE TaxID=2502190 RepID=UPI0010F50B45|nr:TraX family protein [Pseudomonas sp. 2FE]
MTHHIQTQSRSGSLDLIKWLAMATMVIDHLRYIWPGLSWLLVPGRISFPLFCLVIAANVERSKPGEVFSDNNARYLGWLLVFSVISELPYRIFFPTPGSLNVLATLAFGLVIAWGAHHRTSLSSAMAVAAGGLAYMLNDSLMYGFIGTLIPAALLTATKRPGVLWLLPAALCLLINASRHRLIGAAELQVYPLLVLGTAFAAPIFGLWLLRQKFTFQVWPVQRWGYLFYPGHLIALQMLRIVA